MEKVGLIGSAEAIWQAIIRTGREPAKVATDQAAAYGGSTWKPGT